MLSHYKVNKQDTIINLAHKSKNGQRLGTDIETMAQNLIDKTCQNGNEEQDQQ